MANETKGQLTVTIDIGARSARQFSLAVDNLKHQLANYVGQEDGVDRVTVSTAVTDVISENRVVVNGDTPATVPPAPVKHAAKKKAATRKAAGRTRKRKPVEVDPSTGLTKNGKRIGRPPGTKNPVKAVKKAVKKAAPARKRAK